VTHKPVTYLEYYTIPKANNNPNLDYFELGDVQDIKERKVKRINRALFPLHMRCDHVRYDNACEEEYYILEKGGKLVFAERSVKDQIARGMCTIEV
jgi:hypothetical protein